jgi:hypothetical protein
MGRGWGILRRVGVFRSAAISSSVHHEIRKFLQESPSLRRAALAMEVSALRDRHDDLLADHARMVHASESNAKVIARALCRNLKRLDALGWQLREEQKAGEILGGEL